MDFPETVHEASKRLDVPDHTIRRWLKAKELPGKKIGGRWFVVANRSYDHRTKD